MKYKLFSLLAASAIIVACNNDSDTEANADSLKTDSAVTTTTTTSTDYAAKADSIRINSEAGNYVDPRTGKRVRLTMDPSTGRVTNAETGEPVWRYVDRRNWWVYGGDDWDRIGEARLENGKIVYRTDDDRWVTYDERWRDEDVKLEEEWKTKYGDTKVKMEKDGDLKVKSGDTKTKVTDDKTKTKTDTTQ